MNDSSKNLKINGAEAPNHQPVSGHSVSPHLGTHLKQLIWQLEEIESAEAHHEHAHSRPRLRSASLKQLICKSDLAATFQTITKEAQAQLIKLVELETHEVEEYKLQEREAQTQEQRTHEWETYARDFSALSSHEHIDQTPT